MYRIISVFCVFVLLSCGFCFAGGDSHASAGEKLSQEGHEYTTLLNKRRGRVTYQTAPKSCVACQMGPSSINVPYYGGYPFFDEGCQGRGCGKQHSKRHHRQGQHHSHGRHSGHRNQSRHHGSRR